MSSSVRYLIGVVALILIASVETAEARYYPAPELGRSAGLLPECPGVEKNVTISNLTLPTLQLMLHYLDSSGNLISNSTSVTTAHKLIAKEKLNWTRPWILYAVGYLDSARMPHSKVLAASYARRGYNVLVTDTFPLLIRIYPISVRLTRAIGKKLGEFLVRLIPLGLTGDKLNLMGMSLGAHIAAFAARHFHAVTGVKPRRLTGLDPAGPCFRSLPPEMRFNDQDAQHTDVIHTNIDGFGIADPLGQVDFYVNGGEYQPGDMIYVPCLVMCSHVKAVLYWWQALENPKRFIAVKCDSVQDARLANCYNNSQTNYMGLETIWDRPGVYYLGTSNSFPYYQGKAGLKAENEVFTSNIRNINADSDKKLIV